jgi:hypothetical protein
MATLLLMSDNIDKHIAVAYTSTKSGPTEVHATLVIAVTMPPVVDNLDQRCPKWLCIRAPRDESDGYGHVVPCVRTHTSGYPFNARGRNGGVAFSSLWAPLGADGKVADYTPDWGAPSTKVKWQRSVVQNKVLKTLTE